MLAAAPRLTVIVAALACALMDDLHQEFSVCA